MARGVLALLSRGARPRVAQPEHGSGADVSPHEFHAQGDDDGRRAIEYFTSRTPPPDDDAAELALDVDSESASATVVAAGLVDAATGAPRRLDATRHGAYVAAKDAARRDAHARAAQRRKDALARLLAEAASATPGGGGGAAAARTRLRAFGAAWRERAAAHPFLLGLRALVEEQLRSPHAVARWTVDAAALTEVADDSFTRAAVEALTTCAFRRAEPEAAAPGADERVAWEVSPTLSDRALARIARALPPGAALDAARAPGTGTITLTSAPRGDAPGAPPFDDDDDEGYADRCFECCVVS